jgi:PAS domain S-box-containing protein
LLDITERKRAEEALKASERRFRSLLEQLNVGVFLSTLDGKMELVNPATVRMAGYPTPEEFLAVPAQQHYTNPEERRRFIEALKSDGAVRDFEAMSLGRTAPRIRCR